MHRSRRLIGLFIIALCTTALAIDWPQWRGPNRDNLSPETGLLKEWPKGGPPLLWKANGLGKGYSTVAVVGDRIYTMGDGDDGGYARCFSMNDQKQIWFTKTTDKTGTGGPAGQGPGTRATPTVDGEMVYVMGQFGDLMCLKAADGKEVWRKNMKDDFNGKMMSGWGYAESPLVDGDRVVCTPGGKDGTMVALNKKTGETIWRTKDLKDSACYSSIVPAEIAGTKQYVQWSDQDVFGISPEDGKVLWSAKRQGGTAVVPTPIVHDDMVFVSSGYGAGCNCFKITKTGDAFKAEQIYANKDLTNHHGGIVRVGENIYGHSDSRGWVCMEMKSGKVLWAEKSWARARSRMPMAIFIAARNQARARLRWLKRRPMGGKRRDGSISPIAAGTIPGRSR
jgi:outer membrane protein assembly factor BamB